MNREEVKIAFAPLMTMDYSLLLRHKSSFNNQLWFSPIRFSQIQSFIKKVLTKYHGKETLLKPTIKKARYILLGLEANVMLEYSGAVRL
jgi:hypothetical protein